MFDDLQRFLNFARDYPTETDEALPCDPADYAATLSYLCALVPEYKLAMRAEEDNDVERRADRKRALVDGFRRARGAAPTDGGNGNDNGNDNGNADVSRGNRPTEVA